MKNNRLFKIVATIFVALSFIISGAFAQTGNVALSGTVTNTGTIKLTGALSGTVTNIAGTVEFNKPGSQTIPSGYTFTNLTGSVSGTKTLGGDVIVSNILKADAATVAVSSYKLTLEGGSPITIANSGSVTANLGTVDYKLNGTQAVYGTTYLNLTMSGATAAQTKNAGGDVTVTGILTNDANTTLDFSTHTFIGSGATFTNSGVLKSSGTVTATPSPTINGTFEYAFGTADQEVLPATYTNLTFTGAVKKATNGDVLVSGAFTPTYGIDMTTHILTVSGTVGTYGSFQEVKGKMVVAAAGTAAYTLNNAATTVTFSAGEANRTFGLTASASTSPANYAVATDVNRTIAVNYTNWTTATADLKLGYTYAERPTGVGNEAKLKDYKTDQTVAANKIVTGQALARNAAVSGVSFGTVELPGISQSMIASTDAIILAARAGSFMTVASTADWNTGNTWDEGTVPTSTDAAIVATTGVTLNSANSVNSLVINNGKDLSIATSSALGSLTITGSGVATALTNNGTLNVGTATLAGTLTVSANGLDNQGTMDVKNTGANVNVTGTFTNGSSASLTNAGTVTVQ